MRTGSRNLPSPDLQMATLIGIMLMFGMVAVYSAGFMRSQVLFGTMGHFIRRQALSAVIGLVGMYFVSRVSPERIKGISPVFTITVLLGLVLVLIPGIGRSVAGARRWIILPGGLRLQPSEFAKLAVVLHAARYASDHPDRLKTLAGLIETLWIPALFCILILLEPDLDSALIVFAFAAAILFVAGMPRRYILGAGAASIPLVTYLVLSQSYRVERILGFLNPWANPTSAGYQIIQCFTALGSGGLTGRGLGGSLQKLGFLPEPHTDFIFAVIGEEMGFLGATALVLLFAFFTYRGLRIAARSLVPFDRYLATGLTVMIALQALLNLLVVTGLAPTTGVVLPLISYGGSSLVLTCIALGILLGLSRRVE